MLAGTGLACAAAPTRPGSGIAAGSGPAGASRPNLTVIFTGNDAAAWGLAAPPTALSASPRGNLVMAVAGNLFDPGSRKFLLRDPAAVTDCAYTPDGALLVINGRSLGFFSDSAVHALLTLPEDGMRLAAGSSGIYVFGGGATALYRLEPARGYVKICDMPQPVGAAAVTGDTLFIAVANDIYRLVPGGEMQFICRLPGPAITSLAASADDDVYFIAGRSLYVWRAGQVSFLAAAVGDLVCWRAAGLDVLDADNRTLLRFTRLAVAAPATGFIPYKEDANTILLDHFDNSTSASILAYSANGTNTGSGKPDISPNFSFGSSAYLILEPPDDQPAGAATYLKYDGGQLLSQANGTIEFRIFPTAYGSGLSLASQGPFFGSSNGWTFDMSVNSTGQLSASAWSAFALNSGKATVPLNTWTHVAVSWGRAGARLYINGTLVGSDANTGMPADGYGGSLLLRLGTDAGVSTRIDELRVSNIQRTVFN